MITMGFQFFLTLVSVYGTMKRAWWTKSGHRPAESAVNDVPGPSKGPVGEQLDDLYQNPHHVESGTEWEM